MNLLNRASRVNMHKSILITFLVLCFLIASFALIGCNDSSQGGNNLKQTRSASYFQNSDSIGAPPFKGKIVDSALYSPRRQQVDPNGKTWNPGTLLMAIGISPTTEYHYDFLNDWGKVSLLFTYVFYDTDKNPVYAYSYQVNMTNKDSLSQMLPDTEFETQMDFFNVTPKSVRVYLSAALVKTSSNQILSFGLDADKICELNVFENKSRDIDGLLQALKDDAVDCGDAVIMTQK